MHYNTDLEEEVVAKISKEPCECSQLCDLLDAKMSHVKSVVAMHEDGAD